MSIGAGGGDVSSLNQMQGRTSNSDYFDPDKAYTQKLLAYEMYGNQGVTGSEYNPFNTGPNSQKPDPAHWTDKPKDWAYGTGQVPGTPLPPIGPDVPPTGGGGGSPFQPTPRPTPTPTGDFTRERPTTILPPRQVNPDSNPPPQGPPQFVNPRPGDPNYVPPPQTDPHGDPFNNRTVIPGSGGPRSPRPRAF